MRVGDAGTDLKLAGDEEFADRSGIGRGAVRQHPVIGRHDIRHARGRTMRVREGGDDLAIDSSEEHTSELQSLMRYSYAAFCSKHKKNINIIYHQKINITN